MLASANQQPQLDIAGLEVVLPEELKAFFYESGYLPTTAEEYRGNARLRVRSVGEVLMTHTPSSLRNFTSQRESRGGKVLVKDLSRSGVGLLYHQQMFPEEYFQLRFQGRLLRVVAVRCRRLGEKCYELGGRIIAIEVLEDHK